MHLPCTLRTGAGFPPYCFYASVGLESIVAIYARAAKENRALLYPVFSP